MRRLIYSRCQRLAIRLAVPALGLSLAACGEPPPGPAAGMGGGVPPVPVTYVEVHPERVVVEADFAGQLQGSREAEVRARVGGILEGRLYREGDWVEEGAPLFQIDPEPYAIALRRAEADLADARASLSQAEREWVRISGLFTQRVISERERDQALSTRELAEARVALAESGIARARLELGYTTVRAPISGVTGLESLTEGNLLPEGALLTTITQLDPVHVRFSIPARLATARRALAERPDEAALAIELLFPGGERYPVRGNVDFTASTVDPATGNVTLRAVFPNPDHKLKPGQRARVALAVESFENVFVVEAEAVSQGASGPAVFVVDEEGKARARSVALGPIVGGRQVITNGLQAGDRVIVNGQVAVRDGAPVNARPRDDRAG
jgi:membrane fusion protein, multidrug efflux system